MRLFWRKDFIISNVIQYVIHSIIYCFWDLFHHFLYGRCVDTCSLYLFNKKLINCLKNCFRFWTKIFIKNNNKNYGTLLLCTLNSGDNQSWTEYHIWLIIPQFNQWTKNWSCSIHYNLGFKSKKHFETLLSFLSLKFLFPSLIFIASPLVTPR